MKLSAVQSSALIGGVLGCDSVITKVCSTQNSFTKWPIKSVFATLVKKTCFLFLFRYAKSRWIIFENNFLYFYKPGSGDISNLNKLRKNYKSELQEFQGLTLLFPLISADDVKLQLYNLKHLLNKEVPITLTGE